MIKIKMFASALLVAGLGYVSLATHAADASKGKTAYVKHGCWQCHGFMGQGGITGPKLAPEPIALPAMSAFLRNTKGPMPPYMEAVLPEADLADIHAYLQSIPKAADYKSIPLLNPR